LLTVLTTAVELAALGLGAWVTSWHAAPTGNGAENGSAPERPPSDDLEATAAADAKTIDAFAAAYGPKDDEPRAGVAAGPLLVPPPPNGPPPFLAHNADARTRFLRGFLDGQWMLFGLYADDAVRFIDTDGRYYTGLTVNAVATMREVGGEGSFTLQISISPDAKLQATFLGGGHDAETLELSPLVEHPDA